MIKVVCGIIYNNDRIFLCRRKSHKQLGGYWEFPGGKLENNEKPEDALKRELNEELEMTVDNLEYFETVIHKYENFKIELIAYKCELIKTSYTLKDHDKFEWIKRSELINKKLAPADIPIAKHLIST